ncbi:DUF1800 domain-containing protein [Phenylobacterium kunshanense]|uniref:DUF1800 domain-containing protein n=1 Tax=Phenylobacterium kunshanense TaxID=1445034 RepID=A0A328BBT7_9CAUL|nr:DUF1800 domain-containing protein [Phenylobacterium kunshanense]RAK64970.1 DUF1800 domain-containing protein [Phenylobacterium kunshanense]
MSNTVAKGAAAALAGGAIVGGVLAYNASHFAAPEAPAAAVPAETADAVRLAKQATFGPTKAVVDAIVAQGPEAWVDGQLATTGSTYADFTGSTYAKPTCEGAADVALCIQTKFRAQPVAMRFYQNALTKPDQLRQRVAFALSQMIVVSGMKVESTAGIAAFQQAMLTNAFGNYRTILREVTLSAAMGDYLDLAGSNRTQPNQNYARELLQIFSIYPSQLRIDGTVVTDARGASVPTYTEADVDGVARALTGWTYARYGSTSVPFHERPRNYAVPMVQFPASYDAFDPGAKTFLGVTVPAGATPQQNLDAVVDAAFNHPNVGPYVARQLIQHLVTSNPSPAYVARVAGVFNDNGAGVRGDLKAVVRAILLDAEARGPVRTDPDYGKLKEPVLYLTSFLRLMGATGDGFFPYARGHDLNQKVFEAPSVFNFYPWDYPLPQGGGLVSPSTKLTGGGLDFERHNFAFHYTLLDSILGTGRDYQANPALGSKSGTKVNWKQWETFGTNVDGMIDQMDLLMLAGSMTAEQRSALKAAMLAVTDGTGSALARKRAQTGLYILLSSPQFQVDR